MKELDAQGAVSVRGAAVVVRQEDGKVVTKEEIADESWEGTASGGLVGLMVGILGGPLGVLVGGATGVLVGSLFDMDDEDATESALADITKSVRVGSPGLLADVLEASQTVIDAAMANLGGTVLRRSAIDVGTRLSVDSSAPLDATPELDAVSSWLAPAQVSARYPGVWLSERVWATHGHYLNRDLGPAWSLGITRGRLGRLSHEAARPIDYEPAGGRSLRSAHEAISGALPEPLAGAADRLGVLARAATMAKASRRLLRPELARANSGLLRLQTKVASIPALIHVAQCLGIDADYVVFGHVHRLGPLPGDDEVDWEGTGGKPRIVNTGSWIYEPLLVQDATPPHPYWPGGAAILVDETDPQPIGLLDTMPPSALQ